MAGKDSSTAIIVIVIMMVTVLAIGSGWYILQKDDDDDEKSGECPGPDVNADYEYDDDENCVRVGCKTGYFDEGGFCIERRDFSEELYEGTDCVIDGYTFQECNLKINAGCGEVGGGSQLRIPNITVDAIGRGTCEAADYVDCVVPCPEECRVTDDKYTAPEGTACMAGGYELGEGSGYCGTGTQVKTLDPLGIVLEGTGFDTVGEYLAYANPNDICAETKPNISGSCYVDCAEGLIDTSCGSMAQEAYIQDEYGNAVCFDKEETAQYIRGQLPLNQKPKRLPVILAAEVREADGTYDVDGNVAESLRKGLHIKYRSDQGISFNSMLKNDCTLYSTEPCDAPRESVACEIGATTAKKEDGTYDTPCVPQGCERLWQKTLSYGITTHPFGSTGGVTNTCPTYEPTGFDPNGGCQMGADCPVDCVQTEWTDVGGCVSNGTKKQERTTNSDANSTGEPCGPLEQFVECSFGNVLYDQFDNEQFYIKDKNGIYLGVGQATDGKSWLRNTNKDAFTLNGSYDEATLKVGDGPFVYTGQWYSEDQWSQRYQWTQYWTFEKQSDGGFIITPRMASQTDTRRITINPQNEVEVAKRSRSAGYGGRVYMGQAEGYDDIFYLEMVP